MVDKIEFKAEHQVIREIEETANRYGIRAIQVNFIGPDNKPCQVGDILSDLSLAFEAVDRFVGIYKNRPQTTEVERK